MSGWNDEKVIYGDKHNDTWLIVEEDGEFLVVHEHYFTQEQAVLFSLNVDSDWSENMILDAAKKTVDLLNAAEHYPRGDV